MRSRRNYQGRITTAELVREAALEVLRDVIMLPTPELKARVEQKLGKELRFEYFLGNFCGDARFDFYNDQGVGMSLYLTELPARVAVLAKERLWRRLNGRPGSWGRHLTKLASI